MSDKIKCTIGDQTFFVSSEECDDLLCELFDKGYYISKFDMKFMEQGENGEFTEEVKIVGNPEIAHFRNNKYWGSEEIRGYRTNCPIIDFDTVSIDKDLMNEVMNGFYIRET